MNSDVAHDLLLQVADGSEDAASDEVTLDLAKPDFDLIQPRRVGGREVKMNVWMIGEKLRNALGLVRGQVIKDHVNLTIALLRCDQLAEERDELLMTLTGH